MDEFLVCSDLCEENGLGRAADLLRKVSASGGKAFVVVVRGWEYDDCIDEPDEFGHPRSIFLDQDEAEHEANRRNIAVLRENNINNFFYSLDQVTTFSEAELILKISEIMGREAPDPESEPDEAGEIFKRHGSPTIPRDATDDQARAIADLFTLKFAYVVETQIAG